MYEIVISYLVLPLGIAMKQGLLKKHPAFTPVVQLLLGLPEYYFLGWYYLYLLIALMGIVLLGAVLILHFYGSALPVAPMKMLEEYFFAGVVQVSRLLGWDGKSSSFSYHGDMSPFIVIASVIMPVIGYPLTKLFDFAFKREFALRAKAAMVSTLCMLLGMLFSILFITLDSFEASHMELGGRILCFSLIMAMAVGASLSYCIALMIRRASEYLLTAIQK